MRRPLLGLTLVACTFACGQSAVIGTEERVVDEAHVLTPDQERTIGQISLSLERQTGDQLGVVTVQSLQGRAIEQVSLERANRWGLGTKELDNGVLIMVAPNDRRVRVEVGKGLEGLLTDERASEVVKSMLPSFRSGDYGGGIEIGARQIDGLLRSDRRRPQYRAVKQAA